MITDIFCRHGRKMSVIMDRGAASQLRALPFA
jgi:hypothetical protein